MLKDFGIFWQISKVIGVFCELTVDFGKDIGGFCKLLVDFGKDQ